MDKPAMTPMKARNLLILADSYVLGRNRRAIAATIEGMEDQAAAMRVALLNAMSYISHYRTLIAATKSELEEAAEVLAVIDKALATTAGADLLAVARVAAELSQALDTFEQLQQSKSPLGKPSMIIAIDKLREKMRIALAAWGGGNG